LGARFSQGKEIAVEHAKKLCDPPDGVLERMTPEELKNAKFEKNPGPDWVVEYRWLEESDEGPQDMTIYSAATPEAALKEARHSLDAGEETYVILGLQQSE
jgi:hypothetical protein